MSFLKFSGSHYAYYESSTNIPPGYPGAGTSFGDLPPYSALMSIKNLPAFSGARCLEFYYFVNQTIEPTDTFLGQLLVTQASYTNNGLESDQILLVKETKAFEWKRMLFQLVKPGNKYDVS